jgi:hypothetical protein
MSEGLDAPETTLAQDAAEAATTISTIDDYQKVREALVRDSAESQFGEDSSPIEREPTSEELALMTPDPAEEVAAESDTPSSEEAREADSAEPTDEKKRKRTGKPRNVKDRIDKVVWEREEARKEAAELRAKLDALQAPPSQAREASQPQVAATETPKDAEPKEADFKEYGEFVAAKARWAARQEVSEAMRFAQAQQAQQVEHRHHEQRVSEFAKRMSEGIQNDPEFMARIPSEILNLRPAMALQENERPTGATAIADVLVDSDQPHILMEYLSSHEDDFRRISAMHPMLAMREIGKIEVGLVAAPNGSAPAPSSSQAQPPIKPVGSSSAKPLVAHKAPEEINSVSEWRAARKQLLHKR